MRSASPPLRRRSDAIALLPLVLPLLCLVAVFFAGRSPAYGDDPNQTLPPQTAPATSPAPSLPEITVTATRSAREVFRAPYAVQTLDGEYLRGQRLARTLPEALSELPGVAVQKTGRGQGSPFLRGFTGFRTLFLIDGIRLNNSAFREGPNQYSGTLDPLTVERLEVVKGPSSVLYGSDAIGGTVNALTVERIPEGQGFAWDRRLYVRGASADLATTERMEIGGTVDGTLGFSVGATLRDYGDLTGGRHVGEQPNTDYRERSDDAKVTWRIAPGHRLVAAWQHFIQADAPRTHRTDRAALWHGASRGADARLDFDQERRLAYVQWHWGGDGTAAGPFDAVVVSGSWQRQEEDQFQIAANRRRTFQGFAVETPGGFVQLARTFGTVKVTAGGELYHDTVDSYRTDPDDPNPLKRERPRGPVADDAGYDLAGAFVQVEIPIGKAIELSAAGRYTHAALDAEVVDPDPTTAPVLGPVHADWSRFTGGARLSVQPLGKHVTLYSGVAQAFRAPNLSDVTSFDIAQSGELETPSPGLQPEDYVTVDAGLKVRAWEDRFEGEVAVFRTEINGMLVRSPTGAKVGSAIEVVRRNVGDGWMRGMEFAARCRVGAGITLFGNFAVTAGAVDQFGNSPDTALRRRPLSKVPPALGLAGVRYDAADGRWWVEALAQMAGGQKKLSPGDERDTQRIPPGGTPGYTVFTLRGGYRIADGVSASLALENVTDKDYRVHGSGVNEAGIGVVGALDWRF